MATDDVALRQRVRALLRAQGCDVFEACNAIEACRLAQHQRPGLIILGPFGNGAWDELQTAQQIRQTHGSVPLILIPTHSTEAMAIGALRTGINDYFKLPLVFDELESSIKRYLVGNRSHVALPLCDPPTPRLMPMQHMIGESLPMQRIKAYIDKVAMTNSTVLITGESGTGKELVAEMIHHSSGRQAKPLVGINCAAIPDSLLESELFGYEKGAFTGANALNLPSAYVPNTVLPASDRAHDDMLSCAANGNNCCVNQEV